MRGVGAALLATLALLLPGVARAQDADLASARQRLATLKARAESGEVGVLPGPSGTGAPRWVVVDPADVRGQLAALVASGEISADEMERRTGEVRRRFDEGREIVERALADLDARIGSAPPPRAASSTPSTPTPPTRTPQPARTPPAEPTATTATPPAATGRTETWSVRLTGVGGTGGEMALSSLEGRLELTIASDGATTGRVSWEGRPVSDPAVEGSVLGRRVLLRFAGPDGKGRTTLTGIADATGKHVNGQYRVTSGSTILLRGSWSATR